MRICFCSDFHGRQALYEQLDALLAAESPDLLILGGDMFPDGDVDDPVRPQLRFIHDDFVPRLDRWRRTLSPLAVACILGNHDWSCSRSLLQPFHDAGQITLLDHRCPWTYRGVQFLGYSKTPPTPHWAKDLERRDLPESPAPETGGLIWDGPLWAVRQVAPVEYFEGGPSIAEELAAAPRLNAPWIFVCHAPPHDTRLDQLPTIPEPIGSRAVRRFVAERQPMCSLHGHVHESPGQSGSCIDRVDGVLCINPGQTHTRLHAVLFDSENPSGSLRHTALSGAAVRGG